MKKYLIFDFDGVLADTFKPGVEVAVELGEFDSLEESYKFAGDYSSKPKHSRDLNLTDEHKQAFLKSHADWGNALLRKDFDLFHGFVEEIRKIENARLSVVSSGAKIYVEPYSQKTGLDFTHILCIEHDLSKESKVEMVCADWNVDVKDVLYFTDTTGDVIELQGLLGLDRIIGCAWGWHGYEKLCQVLPENQIMKDFGDIHKFLDF